MFKSKRLGRLTLALHTDTYRITCLINYGGEDGTGGYSKVWHWQTWTARKESMRRNWLELKLRLTPWPVYYQFTSRDCDQYEVSYPVKYTHGLAAIRAIDEAYDNAEGPTSFYRIDEAEYNEHRSYHIDHAAEDMNY